MKNYAPQLFLFLLILAVAITLACGSSAARSIQSITISPATADAQDYPGGQVPFTATGYFNTSPTRVAPLPAGWGVCFQNSPTTDVSVSTDGVAQCRVGAAGTYSVFASDFPNPTCLAITPCGGGCLVSGYAQLTCP